MLRKTKDLTGYKVCATDGEFGVIDQFYLDDVTWTVRYLLVRTIASFKERSAFVSPIAIKDIDDQYRLVHVGLKQGKIEDGPPPPGGGRITRRYEIAFSSYYGWPAYWGGASRWGDELYPTELFNTAPFPPPAAGGLDPSETVLLETGRLTGYRMFTPEGELGEIRDLVVSDMSWSLRFLIVDAGPVLPGKQVLISPHWISLMSTSEKMITLDIPASDVMSAPPYLPERLVTRDYELALFTHYGRADQIDEVFVGRTLVRT